ncbi:MAG: leucine-rich repeat domain-containing protein [Asgard group archaeon]|nr:leucine-rich repeat domain-containing protein [Asgard group archaeon]
MGGLYYLSNLKELDLSENQITMIDGLSKLINLERLDLNHNNISFVQGLEKLENLSSIDLSGNPIEGHDLSIWNGEYWINLCK